jgi:hypothetical protein
VIREDRELLAELARLGTAMPSLALRIMDDSARYEGAAELRPAVNSGWRAAPAAS